jgi:hypothetical protein
MNTPVPSAVPNATTLAEIVFKHTTKHFPFDNPDRKKIQPDYMQE